MVRQVNSESLGSSRRESILTWSKARLRVLTWNIHKGVGGVDRRYDLQRTADVIEGYRPDIILLQEVCQGIPRLRRDDQVERLKETLGFHVAFGPEHQFREGGYGNLTLSRFPIHHVRRMDLTVGWRKKRGALITKARFQGEGHSRSLVIHNLHLGLAGSERHIQLSRFLSEEPFRGFAAHTPMIVGGDLNDLWGNLGTKFLAPKGFKRAGTLANTFPAALPIRPLDGLFYRGDLKLTYSHVARAKQTRVASDHLPIIADFRVGFGGRG